jgi:N-acetylmuramoyl-L-alanine amidase
LFRNEVRTGSWWAKKLTTLERSQRALPLGAALLLMLLPALPVAARVSHNDAWARDKFAAAERMREALNGRPAGERTRHQYQQTIDSYRRVYFGAPASSKADASVVAVAELEVEMGRHFDDNKILRDAVKQYEFLRKEYPGSKYRFDALFTIGEIYKDDLDEPEDAKATFEQFLHHYPHNRLVGKARDAIGELNAEQNAGVKEEAAHRPAPAVEKKVQAGKRSGDSVSKAASDPDAARREAAQLEAEKYQRAADTASKSPKALPSGDFHSETHDAGMADGSEAAKTSAGKAPAPRTADDATGDDDTSVQASAPAEAKPGKYPRVTMVRHWSTPDYTRVAIDLEQDVKFGAQRLSKPDRIFFDLYDTKLASTLVGKSFDVDDGFLKKIRVAQYKPGLTRVVLEVDDFSEYNAFLLPNPSRLIIDVHGKAGTKAEAKAVNGGVAAAPASATDAAVDEAASTPAKAEEAVVAEVPPARHPSTQPKVEVAKAPAAASLGDEQPVVVKPATIKGDSLKGEAPKNETPKMQAASADTAKLERSGAAVPNAHKVPKKIVEADEDDPPASPGKHAASVEDLRPEVSGATAKNRVAAPKSVHADDTPGDAASTADDATPAKTAGAKGKKGRKSAAEAADLNIHEAQPTAAGDRSLIRALGLKIGKIVIDPGHGGHDTGTIGPNGLQEKDLLLDVGRRLGKLLETRMGAEVVYTRKDDTFIPLETRTAIANREQSDLFVSIHANSSRDSGARGVETYYLNFTSNPDAMEVAARENAVSEKSVHELGDLVKKITLKEKIEESREFAGDVQQSLQSGLAAKGSGIRDRGVKKAPFIVLIGANMPSILAEISFVSNPTDERKLQTPEYRQRIAESLYRGIQKYVSGLSGVKVASKIAKNEGQ